MSWLSSFFKSPKTEETGAESAAVARANEMRADYKDRYVPVENKFLAMTRQTPGMYERARGVANADAAAQFDVKGEQAFRSKLLAGNAPNSGASVIEMGANADKRGAGLGKSLNSATFATDIKQRTGLHKAILLGQNIRDSAVTGGQNAASLSGSMALSNTNALQGWRSGIMGAVGTAAGAYGQYLAGQKDPAANDVYESEARYGEGYGRTWGGGFD